MNLKPTKKKVVYSLVVALALYFFLYFIISSSMSCIMPSPGEVDLEKNCTDYGYLSPLTSICSYPCDHLSTVILTYILYLIIPFLFVYFLMSLDQK